MWIYAADIHEAPIEFVIVVSIISLCLGIYLRVGEVISQMYWNNVLFSASGELLLPFSHARYLSPFSTNSLGIPTKSLEYFLTRWRYCRINIAQRAIHQDPTSHPCQTSTIQGTLWLSLIRV